MSMQPTTSRGVGCGSGGCNGKVLCCGDALAALAAPCESMIASQLVEHGRLSGDVAKLH